MSEISFKVGDWVYWESQGGGHRRPKMGVVVAVVPPHGDVYKLVPEHLRQKTKLFDGLGTRPHTSYLVAVPTSQGQSCHLYWPRVKLLGPWGNYRALDTPEIHHFLKHVVRLEEDLPK